MIAVGDQIFLIKDNKDANPDDIPDNKSNNLRCSVVDGGTSSNRQYLQQDYAGLFFNFRAVPCQ